MAGQSRLAGLLLVIIFVPPFLVGLTTLINYRRGSDGNPVNEPVVFLPGSLVTNDPMVVFMNR